MSQVRRTSGTDNGRHTWRMSSFESPISISGISYSGLAAIAAPFDDQVTGSLLKERRSGETVDVQLGFRSHLSLRLRLIVH